MKSTVLLTKSIAISATQDWAIPVPESATSFEIAMESTVAASNIRVRSDVRYLTTYLDYWRGAAYLNTTGTSGKLGGTLLGGTRNLIVEIVNAGVSAATWNVILFFQGND